MKSLRTYFLGSLGLCFCLNVLGQNLERVTAIDPGGKAFPNGMVVFNNNLFFNANAGQSEVWFTDGTIGGTQMIDVNPTGSSQPG